MKALYIEGNRQIMEQLTEEQLVEVNQFLLKMVAANDE
jgi:hypothetical protein